MISRRQCAERFDWTPGQIDARRRRYWVKGVHWDKVGGVTLYNEEAIVDWTKSGLIDYVPKYDQTFCGKDSRSGFVYFIQQGLDGPIKIGFTIDPMERLASLQTANPYELHLLGCIAKNEALERELHQKYSHHHLRGEWFSPADEIVDYIADNAKSLAG